MLVPGVAQGCQNALVIVAFAGYLEVFAGCKLLEKRIKSNIKKMQNRKRKRNCFNHALKVLFHDF